MPRMVPARLHVMMAAGRNVGLSLLLSVPVFVGLLRLHGFARALCALCPV